VLVSTPRRYTSSLHTAARFVAQRLLLKPLVWGLVDVKISGRQHLKGFSSAAVVVSNHSSHLDAPLIMGSLPRRLGTSVATGAASDYFFRVWWRKPLTTLFFNAFPIDRSGQRGRNGMAFDLLDSGVPILLFAEGTRSRTGAMSTFKAGAAAMCISRGVPCLPLALVGAYEAMPPGRSWPLPGRPSVHVAIGAPMDAEPGETPREFSRRIAVRVRSMYDEHAEQIGLPTMDQRDRELARGPRPDDLRVEPEVGADDAGSDQGPAGPDQEDTP
jgi:1-acyl-sn-glycerol-3-phosphate acyltransferase